MKSLIKCIPVLFTILILCSCEKNSLSKEQQILGEWYCESSRTLVHIDGVLFEDKTVSYEKGEYIIKFDSNSCFTDIEPSGVKTGAYSIVGEYLVLGSNQYKILILDGECLKTTRSVASLNAVITDERTFKKYN